MILDFPCQINQIDQAKLVGNYELAWPLSEPTGDVHNFQVVIDHPKYAILIGKR